MFSYRSARGRAIWVTLFLLLLLSMLSQPNSLLAASTRYVSPSGTDTGTCKNSVKPCKTITYTLIKSSSGDTIHVAAGTYTEHVDITKTITLIGAGRDVTFLHPPAAGQRIMQTYPGALATISGLTIENASISGQGGGIYNYGSLVLTSVSVSNNFTLGGTVANDKGAGIYNNGSLTVKSSIFSNNWAGASGGGIYNDNVTANLSKVTFQFNNAPNGAGIYNDGTLTVKRGTLDGNQSSGLGGGIYNDADATLKSVTFTTNDAVSGGGIYNTGGTVNFTKGTLSGNTASLGAGFSTDGGTIQISQVTFSHNNASSWGGGMYNLQGANLTLTDVVFDTNSSTGMTYGGGAISNSDVVMHLTNGTFTGNSAVNGGGIWSAFYSELYLTNVTMRGNRADYGGALYNSKNDPNFSGGTSVLINVTLDANTANNFGAALLNDHLGTLTLKNTILANSTSGNNCSGEPITSNGHNLSTDFTCNLDTGLKDIIGANPKLRALKNNGGFTQTEALSKNSPAIDKGTNGGCTSQDQRGMARPRDGNGDGKKICDIGAYEY